MDIGVLKTSRQYLIDLRQNRFADMPSSLDELILSIDDEKLLNQAVWKVIKATSGTDIEAFLIEKG